MSFTGTFYHSLDPKNRVFIPAEFRDGLGENFYIYRSPEKCLCLYNEERWQELIEKNDSDADTPESRTKKRKFFSRVSSCKMDKQGRITIGSDLLAHAQLENDVAIIGIGNCIEIWDTEKWKIIDADEDDELSEGVYF